ADRYNGLVEIVSSRQLHGKEVFVRTDSVMYYYDGDSNLLWLENAGDSVGSYYIHCPKSIGDPHIMDDTIFSSPSPERFWRVTTLVRTNERLETPAGIFNCWYIETMNFLKKLDQVVPDTTYYSQYWFVKNVGLVRQVGYTWYSGKKTLDYTLWLTKYQLF
ncbi:MAG TPA: hypothetical protein VFO76_00935, partial [Candidatus Kapabacteria bacterium]|nr:hypothetical protein [Candidatus Kapabacteria bacterium]